MVASPPDDQLMWESKHKRLTNSRNNRDEGRFLPYIITYYFYWLGTKTVNNSIDKNEHSFQQNMTEWSSRPKFAKSLLQET